MNIVLNETKTIDKVEYDRGWSWDKEKREGRKYEDEILIINIINIYNTPCQFRNVDYWAEETATSRDIELCFKVRI